MGTIYYIGGKYDINNGNILYEIKNGILRLTINKVDIKLDNYYKTNYNYSCELNINKDEINFINGNNIYVYNLDNMSKKNYIYSINDMIFLGYDLKENKKFKFKENKNYLITPSSKIKLGGGKIETDFGKAILNDEKIIRNILFYSYGIIFRIDII